MALQSLQIKNLAVIESAEIDFEKGLTVITGETGSGKSVILKALGLLMGARADNTLIRHDKQSCDVIAEFSIGHLKNLKNWLNENDLEDESNCIIRRLIKRDKGSKSYINGHPANLNQLKELGQQLIDIHGQHEHQQLLQKNYQLQVIDDLATQQDKNHASCLAHIKKLYTQITSLTARAADSQANAEQNQAKIDLLRFQSQELEDLNVKDNEYNELNQEYSRLSHAQELLQGFEQIEFDLTANDNGNAESILGRSIEKITQLAEYDNELDNTIELLNSALANIQEATSEIRAANARTDIDNERLSYLEHRLESLINLARKHHCHENELGTVLEQLSDELTQLTQTTLSPEELDEEINKLRLQYQKLAKNVSNTRQTVAAQLEKHVTEQMQTLGMEGGSFSVKVTQQTIQHISPNGLDDVEFLVATNPGMPANTLNKIASGGELSRISLAIQILAGDIRRAPCLIFDEIDVGVGGGTAEIVGNNLKQLADQSQVLCITHLPQVASKGFHHLQVKKQTNINDKLTLTEVVSLSSEQRIQEIARMLGGVDITANTIAHATEMLQI